GARSRGGSPPRPGARVPRGADVRPRPHRPPPGPPADPGAAAGRQDGLLLDAHPVRRRGHVRPGGGDPGRTTGRHRPPGRDPRRLRLAPRGAGLGARRRGPRLAAGRAPAPPAGGARPPGRARGRTGRADRRGGEATRARAGGPARPPVARGLLHEGDGRGGAGRDVGSLSRLAAVASNTFRETVRERVLYNLVFFAVVMTLSGLLMRQLSVRQDEKIIKDVGLASMDLFGSAIAVFIGVGLVGKEIERRSLFPLLARPLARWEFLLGKFAGLSLTLLVNVSVMTAGLFLTLRATGWPADWRLLPAIYAIYLGLLLTVAV